MKKYEKVFSVEYPDVSSKGAMGLGVPGLMSGGGPVNSGSWNHGSWSHGDTRCGQTVLQTHMTENITFPQLSLARSKNMYQN